LYITTYSKQKHIFKAFNTYEETGTQRSSPPLQILWRRESKSKKEKKKDEIKTGKEKSIPSEDKK
jgi:hypothetical protein